MTWRLARVWVGRGRSTACTAGEVMNPIDCPASALCRPVMAAGQQHADLLLLRRHDRRQKDTAADRSAAGCDAAPAAIGRGA